MAKTRTASCACKKINLTINNIDDTQGVITCYCGTCRKLSGHFVAAFHAIADDVNIDSGKEYLKTYVSSSFATRQFYSECGSQLFYRKNGSPQISIMAGCVNGDTKLEIGSHIFTEGKGDYYKLDNIS